LLDADADRADLELRLIKPLLKDRARVHPFARNGRSWREAVVHKYSDDPSTDFATIVTQLG
jgi:hypothetical protein